MERFVLSINHKGTDYRVEVEDLETANLLLNDASAAFQYMQDLLKDTEVPNNNYGLEEDPPSSVCPMELELQTNNILSDLTSNNNNNLFDSTVQQTDAHNSSNDNCIIWTKKKPTSNDLEATALMLSTRQKMSKLFDDKKSRKAKLWDDVARTLENTNYKLGEKGGERCRQKFANLQKAYLAYIKHQTTTGTEKNDEVPPFFEEMHSILGGKHKVNPSKLEDSMNVEGNVTEQVEILDNIVQDETTSIVEEPREENSEQGLESENQNPQPVPSTSKGCYNSQRFKKGKRRLTPGKQEELIKALEEDRASRSKEFNFLKNHLTKSEEQRDRFLNILEHVFVTKKKKNESGESD